uniref:Vomeromodulin n=1 Tax=Catagonus wagneri TaxID=51154 RepID=A0A8C3W0B2_9CETA
MLAIQAKAFVLLTPHSDPLPQLRAVPVNMPSELSLNFPDGEPRLRVSRKSSIPEGSPSIKRPDETSGANCPPVAKYFLSSSKLNDYLNVILPQKIEKILMCEEINLAGVLGEVISTVSNSDLLSALDITSLLSLSGGGGLGGILGKGTSTLGILGGGGLGGILGKGTGTASLGILGGGSGGLGGSLGGGLAGGLGGGLAGTLSKGTASLGILGGGSGGLEKNPVKEAVDSTGLLDINKPKESTEGILNSVAPEGINNGLKSLLGNVNLEDLLLGLKVEKVTVENITSTITDDGILVFAKTTAFIGGEGLAGPVVGLLGFQMQVEVILKIGISTNNTKSVAFQVQEKDIEVKKVNLQIAETITDTLPLPLPLPLDDTISQLLTVTISKNVSCGKGMGTTLEVSAYVIGNTTGLFNYHVKSSRISAEGLSVFYCVSAHFRQNTSLPGRPLPPDPKNANVSITLSGEMLEEIVAQSANQSSVKVSLIHVAPPLSSLLKTVLSIPK